MNRLHPVVKVLTGIIAIVVVAFGIMNWEFLYKNVSFWWQSQVTGTWEITAEELTEPNQIRIAALNIVTPVVYVDNIGEGYFQEALAKGVVHYPGTALPGQAGNAFYFGHSSDFGYKAGDYKTVFALLPQIELGETIEVSDSVGRVYKYEVVNTLVVSPTQTEVLSQGNREERLLTLQTSYPVGTAFKRFIVQAKLI